MDVALDEARRRPDIPTAATDQDNAQMAEQISGSLAAPRSPKSRWSGATCASFPIDGIEPSLESFEAGSYPFEKPLYFVLPVRKSPAALRFIDFLRSAAGKSALRATGNILSRTEQVHETAFPTRSFPPWSGQRGRVDRSPLRPPSR